MRGWIVGIAMLSGCHDAVSPSETVVAPQPLAPLSSQKTRLKSSRAVAPDARFISAVAALHHFVTGWTVVAPDLERTEKGTRIRYYGKDVGLLPERATFADAVSLLAAWAPKIGKPWALPQTAAAVPGDLVLDGEALETLTRAQADWEKTPSRRAVHEAARGLLGLTLGTCDQLGLADEVAGRALASVILDRLQGTEVDRELALLAERFGYAADAEIFAAKLPENDAARAFVFADDERLARLPTTLARFLEVVRAARKGDFDRANRVLPKYAIGPSVLSLRMCAGDDKVAPPLIAHALLDAALDAGVTVAEKARADVDALRGEAPARVTGIVYGWLGIQRAEGFARFELEVERAGAHDRGPFLDRSTRQILLRARAAAAVRTIGLRLAEGQAPDAADKAFAIEVPPNGSSELGRALHGWHRALIDARRAVPALVLPTSVLGPVATLDVAETALSGLGSEVAEDEWDARAAGHWALARLDARPEHRALAGLVSRDLLLDLPLVLRPSTKTFGIARKIPHDGEAAARAFAEHAPALEGAAAIAAAIADDDPRGAASAIAEIGSPRPRAIAALLGAAVASVRDPEAFHKALMEAGISLETRRAIALGALAHHGRPLAVAMLSALATEARTPLLQIDLVEDAASAMDPAAAKTFRAAHPLGTGGPFAAPILFAHGGAIDPTIAARGSADLATLLAIASGLGDPAKMAALRSRLTAPSTRFAAIARHLVGLEDLESTLLRPTDGSERCELAFYLALAAESAGRKEDAAIWLQTALDEGTPQVAEWRWAAARARSALR